MNSRLIRIAVMAIVIALLPAIAAGQSVVKTPLFRVDVPFPFVAGGMHLPAGPYIVSHVGPYEMVIETQDGKARALVHVRVEGSGSSETTKLVFNKYGDQYFVAQVWTEQDREVHHCTKCRAERILEAQSRPAEQTVVLARR